MSTEAQRAKTRERVKRYRAKQQTKALHDSVTHPDTCRYCQKPIISLGYVRKYPGACYDCSLLPHPKTVEDLWPVYRYTPWVQSTYVMTAFEQEHYKPAHKLADGQYNPVSKPGDKHYKVVV